MFTKLSEYGFICSLAVFINSAVPVFAFARITQYHQVFGIYKELFLGLLIIFFSIISYYFIETPARNKKYKFKNIFITIIILIIFFIVFSFNIIINNGYKSRFKLNLVSKQITPIEVINSEIGKNIDNNKYYEYIYWCNFFKK